MAVFFFHGQEEYFIDKEIKKLKSELLDTSFMSMAYKVFHNPQFATLIECVQSAPSMFGSTLSVVYIDKYLLGKQTITFDDKQIASLDSSLSALSDRVNIIFVCKVPRDGKNKPDSRKKIYKVLSKYAQVREFPQYRSYDKPLPVEIQKMAKEMDLTLSSDCTEEFIQQIGSNLTLIHSELEKVKTAICPKKTVDVDAIKKYCTSSDDVFFLADMLVQGDKDGVLKQYNLLMEKRHPLEIFAALQYTIRKYIFVKGYAKKMNSIDIMRKFDIKNENALFPIQKKLSGISLDELIKIRENLVEAEYKLKTGQCTSNEVVLELALLR